MQDIRRKVYVSVLAEMTPTGYAQPKVITWEDGTHYEIDQIKDCLLYTSPSPRDS